MLLVRMLTNYGVEDEISVGVRALSNSLGLSNKVVTEGVKELCQAQLMMRDYNMGTKGRPKYFYVFFPKLKEILNRTESKAVTPTHQNLINQLLQPDRAPKLKGKQHPLKVSNRLLLIVLLQHASDIGVVSSFSKVELQKMLGITSDRLKSQLNSLMRHGYIRFYTPGVNSKALFGTSKGIYYLNVMHANYRDQRVLGRLFVVPGQLGAMRKEFDSLSRAVVKVFSKANNDRFEEVMVRDYRVSRLRHIVITRKDHKGINKFFPQQDIKPDVENYFQAKIDAYASYLLNHHWSALDLKEGFECLELREAIGRDVINKKYCLSSSIAESTQEILIRVIFEMSLLIAFQIRAMLLKQENFDCCNWNYSILPVSNLGIPDYGASRLVVELHAKNEAAYAKSESLCESVVESEFKSSGFVLEHELDDGQRYRLGLLTRPKPYHNQSK